MRSIICYIPDTLSQERINYVCSDNKVHIRFRDYNSPQVIAGFEQKLTYLLTYLMNYSYLQKTLLAVNCEDVIKGFLKSSDVHEIDSCIRAETTNIRYKGIKLRKKYSKHIYDDHPYGNVEITCFPIHIEDSLIKTGDLNFFISAFKISLRDYLFNDNYIIIIDDIKTSEMNRKFKNKMNKKAEAASRSTLDVAELW